MKILVTGGAGFIGSHIVDALIDQGHDVCIVDNLSTGDQLNVNPKAKLHICDINGSELINIFETEKPEMVFHVAAQIDVRKSVADPAADAKENIIGSINVLECCKKVGVKKIIFSSTGGAIYGEADVLPTPETYSEKPISPYGIAKLAVEKYLHYYQVVHGLSYVVLRYANVYGPRQNNKGEAGVVAIFCTKILNGVSPVINGDGEQTRDYVCVFDVVSANILALNKDVLGIYNIGTGKESSVNQLAREIKTALGSEMDFSHGEAKVGEQQRSCLDNSKAKKELAWEPKFNLQQGIKETANWFSGSI